jgi:hypothetical protein
VGSLLRVGLIKVKESKSWYGRRSERIYQLTIEGFLEILKQNTTWQDLEKTIGSNKQILPEYFEMWESFKQCKVGDVARKLVSYAAQKLRHGLPSFPERIENRTPTLTDWLPRLAIYPYQALIEGVISQGEAQRWHRMLLAVPKAERLYIGTLKWIVTAHESGMKSYSKALEVHYKYKQALATAKWVAAMIRSRKHSVS